MFRVGTLNKISPKGLNMLPRETFEVASEMSNPDAIIVRSAKMHDMELPESLKAIARAGAGYNNVPVEKCSEKGIVVFNTPGANANAVKELTLAGLFMSSRKIYRGIQWANTLKGQGDEVSKIVEKEKESFGGTEIAGKKLGVVGLGAIGVMVANDAESLGMQVIGYDPYISIDAAWGLSRTVEKAKSLDHLLAEADYISLHIPLVPDTKGLINKAKIAIMKNGVKILNFSRGGIVNNQDVIEAVKAGKISRYVIDFPEEELLGIEDILCIPHLGASSEEAEENCAVMAAQQIRNFLETGNVKNSVNFPDCDLPMTKNHRLVVINKNVPNMVGQVTTLIAEYKLNIADMLNKHKGEFAYNIIDTTERVPEDFTKKLLGIEGVLMARVIR